MRKLKLFSLALMALFATSVWADSWTASEIVASSGAGTKKNHVTVSSPGVTSVTNIKMYGSVKEDAAVISSSSTLTDITSTPYLSIQADRGYRIVSASFYGGSNNSNNKNAEVFCWNSLPVSATYSTAVEISLKENDGSSKPADQTITLTESTRAVRIYTKIKYGNGVISSAGSQKGGGNGAIVSVTATAAVAPEIEGDAQMWNDETITLTGYPAGGSWAVVSGPGSIDLDGKLTASGNGTIRVSYTYSEITVTKDITSATTQTLVWTFDTNGTLPTTAGVQVESPEGKNGGFNSDGTFKLSSNGHYAYIDLTSKNYVVTAAVLNAKTGSASKSIDFGSAASDVADGTTSQSSSTNFEDFAITPVKPSHIFSVIKNTGTSATLKKITLTVQRAVKHTISFNSAGGSSVSPIQVIHGAAATKPDDPMKENYRFDGWYYGSPATAYNWATAVTDDIELTAHWTRVYTISFDANGGSGDAPAAIAPKAEGETFEVPANTFTAPSAGQAFEKWNDGENDYSPGATYTVGSANVVLEAQWNTSYAITKGTHEHGDFTISPTSAVVGATITLTATPDFKYVLGAWSITKTSDGSATGITVTDNQFTMPAYGVTVNAIFVDDARKQILYLTTTSAADTKSSDKMYAALNSVDDYNVIIESPASQTLTNYDLIVLHESIGGTSSAAAVTGCKTTSTPVLNTKSWFYGTDSDASARWGWGKPDGGQSIKGPKLNTEYCNITAHPIFAGLTFVGSDSLTIFSSAKAKAMQPIKEFASGKEGYTLATSPKSSGGTGCAIQEIPAGGFRGATSGKYLLISIGNENGCFGLLTENGQNLIKNAVAYLLSDETWTPKTLEVTIADGIEHGSVDVDIDCAAADDEITLSNNPSDGYKLRAYNVYKTGDAETKVPVTDGKFTMPAYAVTVSATFAELIDITCATGLENGSVAADKEKAIEGETVTLSNTPAKDYILDAYDVYKTGDAETKVPVTDGKFTMPAYAVTVSATFKEDPSTALDNTDVNAKAVKRLENGQLIIEKNGVRYNAMGQAIR